MLIIFICGLCIVYICIQLLMVQMFIFFNQKTAYEMHISDWSSDVCSSDLLAIKQELQFQNRLARLQLSVNQRGETDNGDHREPANERGIEPFLAVAQIRRA